MKMYKPLVTGLLIFGLAVTVGCAIPLISKKDRVEIECEYREVFSVATVEKVEGPTISFVITGHRNVERKRSDLPETMTFAEGEEFNVRQRFLKRGNCEPYIFQVLRQR